MMVFFFSSRRRHTRFKCDWSSDVCSSDLTVAGIDDAQPRQCKIAHRARGHADVLAELRLDQHDNRASEGDAGFGPGGEPGRPLTSLSDSTSYELESSSDVPPSTALATVAGRCVSG